MKKNLAIIGLIFLFILSIFINGSPFNFGDGYGYFHNAKSLVTNGFFVSNSKPEYFPYTGHALIESNNKITTPYPPGSAILMWPFLTVAKFFDGGTIYTDYYKTFNGHSFADGLVVLLAASFYAFWGLIIIYKILKNLGFSTRVSLVSVISIYIGSYALSYTQQFSSYSHIYEIFAASLLIYFLILFGKKFENKYMFLAGLAGGLLVLIRPVNVVIVIPIFVFIFLYRNWKSKILFILGGLPFALTFFIFNSIAYGNPLSTGYGISEKLFDFTNFNLLNLLISDVRGWYIYSPIMIIASIGLFFYAWKNRPSFLVYLLPCILIILTYSFWPNWWAGDSLGQRFFLVLNPFMSIGIANALRIKNYESEIKNLLTRIKVKTFNNKYLKIFILSIVLLTTFYSFSIAILYRFSPTDVLYSRNSYTSQKYPEVTPAERFTPQDILRDHLNNLGNYSSKLQRDFNGGRSLALLALGQTSPLAKLERLSATQFKLHLIPNNVSAKINSDVQVGIKQSSSYTVFRISDIDFSKTSEIEFECLAERACVIKNGVDSQKEIMNKKGNSLLQIEIAENLKVDFSAGQNIKLVDYKLKDL